LHLLIGSDFMETRSLPLLIAAAAAFVCFAGLLGWVIARFLRSNREQFIATGRLAKEQEFGLPGSMPMLLMLEVPRFGSHFRHLQFEIVETASGKTTKLGYSPLHAQGAVYGVKTMRVPIGRILLERSGRYLVRVIGLERQPGDSRSRILFSRPYLGRMIAQIIGLVFCGVGLLLSLLLALWQLLPHQP
jgi:hypothetical protein